MITRSRGARGKKSFEPRRHGEEGWRAKGAQREFLRASVSPWLDFASAHSAASA